MKEYREMVMGLHHASLRVIQDVVFNHTSGFGEATNSILDEVVPDYYNRLDADGNLETGSCCADRSKDMDQNSYDSGDWFNKIDWTGNGNNWGIGLPIASQNQSQWPFQQPLLANGAPEAAAERYSEHDEGVPDIPKDSGEQPAVPAGDRG